mgnify:CR=1 FL=1
MNILVTTTHFTCEAVVPEPKENMRDLMGRTEIGERPANIRKKDFEHVEELLTHEELCRKHVAVCVVTTSDVELW